MEQLYSLFSELLERKLKEMEEHRPKRSIAGNRIRLESGVDDEIQDDYMLQFGVSSKQDGTKVSDLKKFFNIIISYKP